MSNILRHSLFRPAARVVVTERTKHKNLAPNSVCFVAQCVPMNIPSPNTVSLSLVNIRNGKRGKDRVMMFNAITTVFPVEFSRPLKTEKWHGNPIVELVEEPPISYDVGLSEPLEFIGWALAYRNYLRYNLFDVHVPNKWPKGKGQPVNSFRDISARIALEPAETMDVLGNHVFRECFVSQIRQMEASVSQYKLNEKASMYAGKLRALAYLLWVEESNKKGWYDLNMLEKSYIYYKSLLENIEKLMLGIANKHWQALPKEKQLVIPKPQELSQLADIVQVVERIKTLVKHNQWPDYNLILEAPKEGEPKPIGIGGPKYDDGVFKNQQDQGEV